MRRWIVVALFAVTAVAGPTTGVAEPVWPGPPSEAVRQHIDEMIGIAGDARLTPAARDDATRDAIARTFDFSELARRALGAHWARLTPAERRDVTAGLRAMLTDAYVARVGRAVGVRLDVFRNRVHFVGESVAGGMASVTLRLGYGSRDLPLSVALVRHGREWRIWDLAMDGVQLTDNIRAQVARLSRGADYGEVLARLRAR
ncbi:MAG TPA: ABC transporter substrate-binding protein [Methylomirabilota bacterium]|jgi:phospholipid transport system substrate-binding protein|nr:ABC transporter substrate-binding protein [Methylomirabilota bacterium]